VQPHAYSTFETACTVFLQGLVDGPQMIDFKRVIVALF
jgi:hypothetical protein